MKKPEAYFEINELVSRLCELQEKKNFNFGNVIATVLSTPTLKIVRCKDCEHYQEWEDGNPPTCKMWTDQWDMSTKPNGYCHYGEVKIEK